MHDTEGVPGPRRGHLRTRDWTRVSHGLFRPTQHDARVPDLAAWALILPATGAFTHLTAAREHGWWLPPLPEGVPVFASMATTEFRPRRDGLRVSQHPAPIAVVRARGLTLASPAETLLACARDLRLLDMVVLVDAALHSRACTREDVARASAQRRRGAPLFRKVLLHADGRSESAWESVLRMLHRVCDVPVEPQHTVYDGAGSFVARGDLWIIGTRTLHEYDGGGHRTRARQRHDLRRERWLGNEQW